MQNLLTRVGIGKETHRFLSEDSTKPCVVSGTILEDVPGLDAESDGDVVLHAICHAITSLTGVPILRGIAKDLCRKDGITDSTVYVQKALETLGSQRIVHVSISLEGKRPYFDEKIPQMRKALSSLLSLPISSVGITAISGEGLSDVGCGDGICCIAVLTTQEGFFGGGP